MEEMRKQFEVWALSIGCSVISKRDSGYLYPHTASLWEAWKESRAALAVELPSKITEENRLQSGHVLPEVASYDEAIDDCTDAIREAGITVKGES